MLSNTQETRKRLKIAILGTRGVPANYGGFETFAEQLSMRLVSRGHDVTVYGRSHYVGRGCRMVAGVHVRRLPAIRHKYLETVSHTALSVLHALFGGFDVLLVCNAANAVLCGIPRLAGQCVVLNVDGIERLRRKWNWWGRVYSRLGEWLATRLPGAVVTDARTIQEYYRARYQCESHFIPYGAPVGRLDSRATLDSLGLQPGHFFLYVSRLEPENNAHLVIEARRKARIDPPLVVVGDAPYSPDYIRRLRELAAGEKVLLPGAIYGTGYRELLSHCLCYIQATEVGGTHPALVEAMGAGCLVLANDTPENREVLADCGLQYRFNDLESLRQHMETIASDPTRFEALRRCAQERVKQAYNWERIVDQYEELFLELAHVH